MEGDYLLPTPSEGDPGAVRIKIFLLATPKFMELTILKQAKVGDLIRHIMTVYRKDPLLGGDKPLQYPKVPEAYELRLIDDDEGGKESYKPFYEVGALDTRERVGEYASLAFVQVRNYKPKG